MSAGRLYRKPASSGNITTKRQVSVEVIHLPEGKTENGVFMGKITNEETKT